MYAPLLHMLAVASHAGVPARVNWYPWTTDDQQYHGWRLEPHDGGTTEYLYIVPDLDADHVAVTVYKGEHGDPEQDHKITRWDFLR